MLWNGRLRLSAAVGSLAASLFDLSPYLPSCGMACPPSGGLSPHVSLVGYHVHLFLLSRLLFSPLSLFCALSCFGFCLIDVCPYLLSPLLFLFLLTTVSASSSSSCLPSCLPLSPFSLTFGSTASFLFFLVDCYLRLLLSPLLPSSFFSLSFASSSCLPSCFPSC